MKTLEFDLLEWQQNRDKLNGMTSLQSRKFKQQFFKGSAFNSAFPLSNYELPQYWGLKGTVTLHNDDEYEFEWKPDGYLAFTDFINNGRRKWVKQMREISGVDEVKSIKCMAYVR